MASLPTAAAPAYRQPPSMKRGDSSFALDEGKKKKKRKKKGNIRRGLNFIRAVKSNYCFSI
jgi:hypothetical protein